MPSLPRLYVITDRARARCGLGSVALVVQAAAMAGARMFGLRDKGVSSAEAMQLGHEVAGLAAAFGGLLLVNDRADLALELAADGVHRPSSGLTFDALRRLLGQHALIGASAHSLDEARAAQQAGASFVTLSPIFESASKPGYGPTLGLEELARVADELAIPIYALGGVRVEDVGDCLAAGAFGVAVMGGIMAAQDPQAATASYLEAIDAYFSSVVRSSESSATE
ncbi:MAG: thiamine phosphate synthase [Bradymonadaceae bacterium]|nr:thiamine phosphate synthase [Lujinxingiaceae bacterium]